MKVITLTIKFVLNIPKNLAKLAIRVYQKLLSFDHSFWAGWIGYRVCIHYPSCSEYTYESIDRFGLIRGSVMGFFRVLRCNPFNEGGFDPVPDHFSIRANKAAKDATHLGH
ncbi:membrane protein insertion efficiency factor YidD [Candidatus Dojkabacteria bacterium]|uniref:Putative membrane protein insertion efficiency factor n=1 Tax=Candidatus Dojkabacteria bacterium TaxID=2099670 RepID=A0A955I639_9BACT|nr:membrane protein insertion efficiency factor YidD [Candidatus Dojkabacteria bacterium]